MPSICELPQGSALVAPRASELFASLHATAPAWMQATASFRQDADLDPHVRKGRVDTRLPCRLLAKMNLRRPLLDVGVGNSPTSGPSPESIRGWENIAPGTAGEELPCRGVGECVLLNIDQMLLTQCYSMLLNID
jgi:hypothetical protein